MGSKQKKTMTLAGILVAFLFAMPVFGQESQTQKSQEMSEAENVPVLMKHLPDWESKKDSARYFVDETEFRNFFSARPLTTSLDFFAGTEAVFAQYNEGGLLIVEYTTPQAATEIDKQVLAAKVNSQERLIYKKIGNYAVMLFDPADVTAGNVLVDRIKYQKVVTWPYGNPKPFFEREREFIVGTTSLFISTVLFILTGLGSAVTVGAIAGIIYFKTSDRRRAARSAYSDAGGLTRLNLDGLTTSGGGGSLLDE